MISNKWINDKTIEIATKYPEMFLAIFIIVLLIIAIFLYNNYLKKDVEYNDK